MVLVCVSYNFYDTCPHDLTRVKVSDLSDEQLLNVGLFAPIRRSMLKDISFICVLESFSSNYLDMPAVQKSIHVTQANVSYWNACGAGANTHSRDLIEQHRDDMRRRGMLEPNNDLGDLYRKLIKQIPVLIYSGDVDQCVPYYYSDIWVREMGYPVKDGQEWRAWTYGDAKGENSWVGGYVTEYDEPNGLTFLTIKDGPTNTDTHTQRALIPYTSSTSSLCRNWSVRDNEWTLTVCLFSRAYDCLVSSCSRSHGSPVRTRGCFDLFHSLSDQNSILTLHYTHFLK